MFVDIPFSTRKMKEEKERIRKEWAEKTNELEKWKTEWGERHKKGKPSREDAMGRLEWKCLGKKGGQGRV